jgi:type II secretory pathway predicted ATPase ExeA
MNAVEQVKNFFGFIKLPFSKGLSVNELYHSASIKNMLSGLEIAMENEEAALITGISGCGKSNALRYFISKLNLQDYKPAYISVNQCKIGEIAKKALLELGVPAPYQAAGALRKLRNTVIDLNLTKGQKIILMIDEAQELSVSTLIELKSLLNYNMDNENLLFLLLCGHRTLKDNLNMTPLESLNRRIRIRCEILPLTLEETGDYIMHHLKKSGLNRKILTDDSIALIYQLSRGVPSEINRYCFEVILKAVAQSKEIIEPSLIDDKKN